MNEYAKNRIFKFDQEKIIEREDNQMCRRRKILTQNEIKEIAQYQWANINDIMDIGAIGKNNARIILNEIMNVYYQDRERIKNGLVPMSMVLDYFNISIESYGTTNE